MSNQSYPEEFKIEAVKQVTDHERFFRLSSSSTARPSATNARRIAQA